MLRRACLIGLVLALVCFAASPDGHPQRGTAPATKDKATADEYNSLIEDIRKYNSTGTVNGWLMNSEHLFIGYDEDSPRGSLLSRANRFLREDGDIDLLFGRIADPKTDPDEILAIAEILVYYAQHHEPGDDHVTSAKAVDVRKAIDAGRLNDAERKYPDAPIRTQILWALAKSSRSLAKASTQPTSAPANR